MRDNTELLELLVADWKNSSARFQPQGDLKEFYDQFISDLRARPLDDNIRKAIRGLTAIGGCDFNPIHGSKYRLGKDGDVNRITRVELEGSLNYLLAHPEARLLPYELSIEDLNETAYRICETYGNLWGARPLSEIEMSTEHLPEYTFKVDGKTYSYWFLYYYLQYAYLCRFVDFDKIGSYIEIGSGAGRQVEIFKKCHPNIEFYIVDIGPTLYVAGQYLEAMFPGAVVPYEDIRRSDVVTAERGGDILPVGVWQIEKIAPRSEAISINSAALCLLAPDLAKYYLGVLARVAKHFYLMEPPNDHCKKLYNMDDSAELNDYLAALDGYELVDRSPSLRPLNLRKDFGGLEMTYWRRRDG